MVKNACELHFRKETCNSTEHLNGLKLYRASDNSRKKNQNFAGFSGANSRKNWPILRDFHGKKVKICEKVGRFCGILAEKKSNFEGFSEANS